jgi:hypothetical protein
MVKSVTGRASRPPRTEIIRGIIMRGLKTLIKTVLDLPVGAQTWLLIIETAIIVGVAIWAERGGILP